MPAPPFSRISDPQASTAREKYAAETSQRNGELAKMDATLLYGRAVSSAQLCDALQAHIEGLEAFIRHARLSGKDAARVLRDDALRLLFIDEARRRKGL